MPRTDLDTLRDGTVRLTIKIRDQKPPETHRFACSGSHHNAPCGQCKRGLRCAQAHDPAAPAGSTLGAADVQSLLTMLVDIVVYCERTGNEFRVTDIYQNGSA